MPNVVIDEGKGFNCRARCESERKSVWQSDGGFPAGDEGLVSFTLDVSKNSDWPAYTAVFSQIGGRSPETGVQMCEDNPPFPPSIPLFAFSSTHTPLLWLASVKKERKGGRAERSAAGQELASIVLRAEFGRAQIRESARLVMIRGSGLSNGFKGWSSVSQSGGGGGGCDGDGGGGGVATSHLQNTGLAQTMDQSSHGFPGKSVAGNWASHWQAYKRHALGSQPPKVMAKHIDRPRVAGCTSGRLLTAYEETIIWLLSSPIAR